MAARPGRKYLLRPPWPALLLAAGAVAVVYLLRAPTHEYLGPWLFGLTGGQRAAVGVAVGAAVGLSVVLVTAPPLRRRFPIAVWFFGACATLYWFVAAMPRYRSGRWSRVELLAVDDGRFFIYQASWYVLTSLVTYLVVATAGLNVVYRTQFRQARAKARRRRRRVTKARQQTTTE